MKLDEESNILLIGCEGDTDQEMYQKLINQQNYSNEKNNKKKS